LVVVDLVRPASLAAYSLSALAAENLFLRKQLAPFQERKTKPRRADDSTRWMMVTLSRMFPWRDALVNVKADTLLRWHRKGFRLFWRWKSQPTGRPRLPGKHLEIAGLFRTFRVYNPLDGECHSTSGVGGSVNFNVALTKNFRIFSNNYYSDGGGRWIFGLAPDLIVRPDASLSPLHSGSTVDGFELQNGNTLLYAYYGGVWITRSGALDFAGKTATLGVWLCWLPRWPEPHDSRAYLRYHPDVVERPEIRRNAGYGAVFLRNAQPVVRPPGAPPNARLSMFMLNLRYLPPGSAPKIE
jgi:hypothetical protein